MEMPSQSTKKVIKQIEALTNFLKPQLKLANCHMVDLFTRNLYSKYIPCDIQDEIQKIGFKETTQSIFHNDLIKMPALRSFVQTSANFTLKNMRDVCLSVDDLLTTIKTKDCPNEIQGLKLEIFMSNKKSHEVEILSALTAAISKMYHLSHLIDLGDGKGYLSSMLALHHKIPVLGVDASNINTCGAVKRVNKLSKVWKGVAKRPLKSYPGKEDDTESPDVGLYKQVTQFVDESFDLKKLVCDVFSEPFESLGIVGLHTCGDLAPSSLRIFHTNRDVKVISNVGCCYHLLSEKFDLEENLGYHDCYGFPMSQFLSNQKMVIGRSARMIANQSVERILETNEVPNKTIFYRALLQVLFEKHCLVLPTKRVGRFKKGCGDFVEYARRAMERVDVKIDVTDLELADFEAAFSKRIDEVNVFYLLRAKLAPVVESLVLLDRLLFLLEEGWSRSYLVHLFDPVISPRCYGIVAIKDD